MLALVKWADKAMKWTNFESQLTTTKITYLPSEQGDPVMKSMEMSSQIRWGIGDGCSNPTGGLC